MLCQSEKSTDDGDMMRSAYLVLRFLRTGLYFQMVRKEEGEEEAVTGRSETSARRWM